MGTGKSLYDVFTHGVGTWQNLGGAQRCQWESLADRVRAEGRADGLVAWSNGFDAGFAEAAD
jgi:hypothetical protein